MAERAGSQACVATYMSNTYTYRDNESLSTRFQEQVGSPLSSHAVVQRWLNENDVVVERSIWFVHGLDAPDDDDPNHALIRCGLGTPLVSVRESTSPTIHGFSSP